MSKRKKRQLIEAVIENTILVSLFIGGGWAALKLASLILCGMGVG